MGRISRTQLDILRHGEHVLGDVICGVTDPELSDKGWSQLQAQCDQLRNQDTDLIDHRGWDVIITSPRKRCALFAKNLADELAIPCIEDPGFAEVDFGDWEALSFTQISERHSGQWQDWIRNHNQPAPHGGEVYGQFLDRVSQSLFNLIAEHSAKRILLFAHGGVIRAVLHCVLGLKVDALSRFSVPHACHSRIMAYHYEGQKDWYQLDRHNTCYF